jgi:site-specific recombinase XerD
MKMKLVGSEAPLLRDVTAGEALEDHQCLLNGYLMSHRIRGHAATTVRKEEAFLYSWFEEHGPEFRPLYTWEAMNHLTGRSIIVSYSKVLLESGLRTETIRSYLGILRRYFSYVLEHPLLVKSPSRAVRIQDRYGVVLDQPVSEFDMPAYVYEGERAGVPLDPERLYDFHSLLRREYLKETKHMAVRRRNYAMAVVAGESGLRVDELLNLDIDKDLFFESRKLQTRHGKAAKGSGKRARITLFTPLARDTLRFYLKESRPGLKPGAARLLFISRGGGRMSYAGAQAALKDMVRIAQRAKFPVADHMSWHWFRRIFATRFVERFPNRISALIELLGHMSPNTVHRYIRHSEAWMDRQIFEALKGAESWPSNGL